MSDQPAPTPNGLPAVWDLVIEDMQARDRLGAERYGTRLQPHNGRDALRDGYEEQLDGLAYTKQHIIEAAEAGREIADIAAELEDARISDMGVWRLVQEQSRRLTALLENNRLCPRSRLRPGDGGQLGSVAGIA